MKPYILMVSGVYACMILEKLYIRDMCVCARALSATRDKHKIMATCYMATCILLEVFVTVLNIFKI